MKIPKSIKRHCPYCKKHTDHRVTESKKRTRGTARPMSRDSKSRQRARGRGVGLGMGSRGKYSRPPVAKWKQTGKKLTKKTDFRYECSVCKKQHMQSSGLRAKKIEII